MKCEQIQPNLLDYATGLLSGPEAQRIADHLAQCPECAALLDEEIAFSRRLSEFPDEAPANDVWALVRARTKPARFRPVSWLRAITATGIRRATAAAVAAAIVLVAFFAFNPADRTPDIKPRPTDTVKVKWSDDPLGGQTDAMIEFIDNM